MNENLRISKLKLSNYRNYKSLQIIPKKNIILISGKNGSGKTNILEAISLFDSANGFRNANLTELINYDLSGPVELFGVNIHASVKKKTEQIGLGIQMRSNILKKVISLNSQRKKNFNLNDFINIFWVLPKMSHLFLDSPEERRNFLDLMISNIDELYKKKLLEYKKLKNERLKILKQNQHEENNEWLDILEKKMSEVGIVICDSRRVFLNSLNSSFKKIDDQIPLLSLKLNGIIDKTLEEKPALYAEEFIFKTLKSNRVKDAVSGRTNFSIDKTDLLVFDRKTDKEAKNFSTGEQKIIIISIIFSYLNILEKIKANKVLFLLDDIFSYLDHRFIKNIIMKLDELKLQTWITDVQGDNVSEIKEFNSIIHNINIDDYRFKVANNKL